MAITREEIYIKARMMSEGVRVNIPGTFKKPTPEELRANDLKNKPK